MHEYIYNWASNLFSHKNDMNMLVYGFKVSHILKILKNAHSLPPQKVAGKFT